MPLLPTPISRPLEQLRRRLDTALDRSRPRQQREMDTPGREARPLIRVVFGGPAVDVEETADTVIVRAELPGFEPTGFTIETTANQLTIRGEKREESEERGQKFHRVERRYGAFVRNIVLPCQVDRDRTEASYRDGVLRVTLPKTEAARARPIKINVA